MTATANSSSSPAETRLLEIEPARLRPHPANPNLMPEELLTKLEANIQRGGSYPPLVVRSHPSEADAFEILDGEQRWRTLTRLGHETASCFLWECDDATALTLLATLNRLHGEDVPARRAELLAELSGLVSVEELALLLPEDEAAIEDLVNLLDLDSEALLADLEAAAERSSEEGPRLVSFAVLAEDEALIEAAIGLVSDTLEGSNRRGRALGLICRSYLEVPDDQPQR